ncbi:hypothetical protein [Streptomyces scopuliridis]
MSDPLPGSPTGATAPAPEYPMPRATGCPFDPRGVTGPGDE